jgi:hypothetical protein
VKVAYIDCFAGASRDMILGSLIDAGLDVEQLKGEVGKLHLTHYDLGATKVTKKGMGGTQAVVSVDEDHHSHHHHTLHHIEEILQKSDLHKPIKQRDIETFTRLADAEAKVHRSTIYSTLPPPRKRLLVFRPISPCPETHSQHKGHKVLKGARSLFLVRLPDPTPHHRQRQ